ncbi:phage tail protein [Hydrocarboniphaga effusa]|uniref:phage tail protein n=1 Tax=Hydrocarboniphaga effusa TaxID=243629 RepID=UPI003BA88626
MALNAPIFSWVPSYEPEISREARLIEVRFGDGYAEHDADGLNFLPRNHSLQWVNEERQTAYAIDNMLVERGGYKPFYYVEPAGETIGLYVCRSWRMRQTGPIYYTLTATFEEDFSLPNEFALANEMGLSDYTAMLLAAAIAVNTETES